MRKKGSTTNWNLIVLLCQSTDVPTNVLKEKGYNPFTIRRYRKHIEMAKKELLGLK